MLRRPKGPYVVGFNGPPRSGKDTLATQLQAILDDFTATPVHRQALAATMRDGAAAILGMSGGDKWYSETKDKPLEVLNGETFRRFMIDMSEQFVKPIYGYDFWARLMYDRNKIWWNKIPSILLITDIGFPAEVEFLCKRSESYLGVRLDRPGCDFSMDSRNWVASQIYGGTDFAYTNDDTVEEGAKAILEQMYRLGWPLLD